MLTVFKVLKLKNVRMLLLGWQVLPSRIQTERLVHRLVPIEILLLDSNHKHTTHILSININH